MSPLHSQLRYGPYITPVTSRAVRVVCQIRGLVRIVGTSDGPIPWPVGEQEGQRALVVYKGLARALMCEEPKAVAAAWGIAMETVGNWRNAIVPPRQASPPQRPQPRRQVAKHDMIDRPELHPHRPWTAREDHVISVVAPKVVARAFGRSLQAVLARRQELGLPIWPCNRQRPHPTQWQAWEDALLTTLSIAEAASRTGRTWFAVAQRRHRLGLTKPPAAAVAKARLAKEAKRAALAATQQSQAAGEARGGGMKCAGASRDGR